VVLSTHSPYFVSWPDIENGAKIYRTSLVQNDGARIRSLKSDTVAKISGIASDKKNRKLYDVVAKEIFFSLGCLFVEGQEDAHIISHYLEESRRRQFEIFGYGSGGASHIPSWLQLASDLEIRAVALFDGDEAGQHAFAVSKANVGSNPNILLLGLPTTDIRDKPDQGKEGVFDASWRLKPEYKERWDTLLDEVTNFLAPQPN
jgi:predicted ATP-dependent endonuclease of OLD family